MHRLEITRRALRSMRRIPKDRGAKILSALEELRALEEPEAHHNVKSMKGDWGGFAKAYASLPAQRAKLTKRRAKRGTSTALDKPSARFPGKPSTPPQIQSPRCLLFQPRHD
jgi:hypothetical protein